MVVSNPPFKVSTSRIGNSTGLGAHPSKSSVVKNASSQGGKFGSDSFHERRSAGHRSASIVKGARNA